MLEAADDTNLVSKVVVHASNGDVLLIKRADGDMDWDLPGGHLVEEETHEAGAKRETKEETNLDIQNPQHISDYGVVKFFKAEHPGGEIKLDPKEHTEYKWVKPQDLGEYSMRKSLSDAITTATKPVSENFQQQVKKNYSKYKIKLIGSGPNKYNVTGKMQKPSYKRAKSAAPGFGGSMEESKMTR